jgi:hypothetical protein
VRRAAILGRSPGTGPPLDGAATPPADSGLVNFPHCVLNVPELPRTVGGWPR